MRIIKELKLFLESKRYAKSIFWSFFVLAKDIIWAVNNELVDFRNRLRKQINACQLEQNNEKKIKVIYKFKEYFNSLPISNDYIRFQKNRFIYSMSFIKNYLDDPSKKRILITDDRDHGKEFISCLKHFYPDKELHFTKLDIRTRRFPFKDNSFDMILCMEVIEHLPDRNEDYLDDVNYLGRGVKNALLECNRVIKDTGILFLSTPNVNSYRSLYNLLIFSHPYTYLQHPREHSITELKEYIDVSGFSLETNVFVDSWNQAGLETSLKNKLESFVHCLGYNTKNREDDIFILARKKGTRK